MKQPNRLTVSGNLQFVIKTENKEKKIKSSEIESLWCPAHSLGYCRSRTVGLTEVASGGSGRYRCGNRNHLRLICHGNLWNCSNHIRWSTQLDWRWWCACHFGFADLNSVGVSDLNCVLYCRWLQLVDMSTPNNPWCHLHLVHQRICLVDNQSLAPLQIPAIIS